MSFSSDAKLELAQLLPRERCCALSELGAILRVESWSNGRRPRGFSLSVGFGAAARKVYLLLKGVGFAGQAEIERSARQRQRRAYRVRAAGEVEELVVTVEGALGGPIEGAAIPKRECCRMAYLRGAFLCRGSLSAPARDYHLEFSVDRREAARSIVAALRSFDLPARSARRKSAHVVYLKESDGIVAALSLMGAHGALLEFENVRIVKEMRNRVNRLVNCETANVQKTVDAASSQLDAIRFLERTKGLDALPQPLREVARLRLEHPYASLRELGELLTPRVTKSGVSYRMKKLERLAEEEGARLARRRNG